MLVSAQENKNVILKEEALTFLDHHSLRSKISLKF